MTIFSLTEAELRERSSAKWQLYGPDVLPLWVAEMDAALQPAVRASLLAAMDRGDTGYPHGTAYADAYRADAVRRWGLELAPSQVRRGGDVMNAVLAVLEVTTKPGDAIVITAPVYPPFWAVTSGYHRRTLPVGLTPDGRLDLVALEQVLAGDDVTAMLLSSPHNPTGTVHTAEELAALAQLCRQHNVRLIVDEIHAWLIDPGKDFVPILSLPDAEDAVVLLSAGKAWNLAAFKAGLYVAGANAVGVLDALPPLAPGAAGHMGSIVHTAALRDEQAWVDQVCREIAEHKQLLSDLLHALLPAARYRREPGTYLAWVDCSALGLDNPKRHFEKVGKVAFSAGETFSPIHDQFVRINLATSPQIITQAVERMATSLRMAA